MRIAVLSLALLASQAAAHGPWPYECCHERDCAEVESRFIREDGDRVHITIPAGAHPMWPADGRTPFTAIAPRSLLRKPVTGEWGVCIGPGGALLCVFPPMSGA
jgi:hypothetical protein